MEIIKLASAHVPFDTRIFQKEARSLAKAGHRVTLIVPHNKYEITESIQIVPVDLPQNGKERLTKTLYALFKKAVKQNKEAIIHFHDSEWVVYALILSIMGRRVVYDAHEDTPRQMMYQHWIPAFLRKPMSLMYFLLEKLGGWLFDHIIVAEPVIGRYFPAKKTTLIRNFPIVNEQGIEETPYARRDNNVVYVGGITEARGAKTMIKALETCKSTHFRFVLGGRFHPPKLEETLKQYEGWNRVDYKGRLSRKEVAEVLNNARVGIIIPEPNPRYTTNYPVKLFEYMEAGIPVVASREGISSRFVEEAGCGILTDPLSAEEVGEAIDYLLNNPREAEAMGKRGKEAILKKYNWAMEEKKLLRLYKELEDV